MLGSIVQQFINIHEYEVPSKYIRKFLQVFYECTKK
jgi:hypothetical protein